MIRWLSLYLFIHLTQCANESQFRGHTKPPEPQTADQVPEIPPTPVPPPPIEAIPSVGWNLHCQENGIIGGSTGGLGLQGADFIIDGEGPHPFHPERLAGSPIQVSGDLCPMERSPRRVVVVVDVSGSMETPPLRRNGTHSGNDPLTNGTCGRLKAIEGLFQSQNLGQSAEVAVVTFGSDLISASRRFHSDVNALATELVSASQGAGLDDINFNGQLDIVDVVCAGTGSTNYEVALEAANQMLFSGTAADQTSQEIYFISDGLPQAGSDPVPLADQLKQKGATIATMMLDGDPETLLNMASLNRQGEPYHAFVDDADDLADALAELAVNEWVGGELHLRPIGGGQWETIDLMNHMQGNSFQFPAMALDPSAAPGGLEVYLEYWDRLGNVFEVWGQLVWVEDLRDSL